MLNQHPIEGQETVFEGDASRHFLQWVLTLLGILAASCLIAAIMAMIWLASMVLG